ncbi:hypothetical protein HDU96_006139 [Phlyctochytrium bullatum]|nr:hypothetical protein HDU96_006139 [Phlyctochytrium bullatum]
MRLSGQPVPPSHPRGSATVCCPAHAQLNACGFKQNRSAEIAMHSPARALLRRYAPAKVGGKAVEMHKLVSGLLRGFAMSKRIAPGAEVRPRVQKLRYGGDASETKPLRCGS